MFNNIQMEKPEKNFTINLVRREKNFEDDGNFTYDYVFQILMDGNLFEKKVNMSEINSFSWVENATYGLAHYTSKKDCSDCFYEYVHEVIDTEIPKVPVSVVYKNNGWHFIDGTWLYVTGDGVVGNYKTDIKGNPELCFPPLQEMLSQDSELAFLKMENVFNDRDISRFLSVFTTQSVLGTIFEEAGYPIKSITALIGTTNTMKTSTARVFTQIYGRNRMRDEVTFQSTKGGIETYFEKYRDAILFVDDFMPPDSNSELREMKDKLKMLVRAYGDGVVKSRMAADSVSRRKSNKIYGSCLFTGEFLPGVKSSLARIVELKIKRNGVNLEWLSYFQNNPQLLSCFIYKFINWCTNNMVIVMDYIRRTVPYYRNKLKFSISRYNEAAAQMMVMVDLIQQYLVQVGYGELINKEDWNNSILNIFQKNDEENKQTDYGKVIADSLLEGIELVGGTKPLGEIGKNFIKVVYEDEKFFYVRLKDLEVFYKEFCQRYNMPFYLSQKELKNKLLEDDMLETVVDYRGYVEISRKLAQSRGNGTRYLYVKKQALYNIVEMETVENKKQPTYGNYPSNNSETTKIFSPLSNLQGTSQGTTINQWQNKIVC